MIPGNIKRVLESALLKQDTVIREFTAELHRELNLPADWNGGHVAFELSFRRMGQVHGEDATATLPVAEVTQGTPNRSTGQEGTDVIAGS